MVKSSKGARIGVVSDTHGYLDPQVLQEFAGVDHIIHAGDIMDAATLDALGRSHRSPPWPATWTTASWASCRARSRARWMGCASSSATSASAS